ncbi:MAG: YtxH domain-containing protein [Bacteroidales bacterium]|jgi:gas vesicle protein|nr:YtxH domain-containing protein [Bacteroidales bacterium]MDP3398484.1 YtxH domain-containing protein [Bacteroidales bacterium]
MGLEKVLLGALAGLAVGVVVGVLFAPEKGSVTRKKITQKSEDYADILKNKFDEFVDSVTEKAQDISDVVSEEKA